MIELKDFEKANLAMGSLIAINGVVRTSIVHHPELVGAYLFFKKLETFIANTTDEIMNEFGQARVVEESRKGEYTQAVIKKVENFLVEIEEIETSDVFTNDMVVICKNIFEFVEFTASEESIEGFAKRIGGSDLLVAVVYSKFKDLMTGDASEIQQETLELMSRAERNGQLN